MKIDARWNIYTFSPKLSFFYSMTIIATPLLLTIIRLVRFFIHKSKIAQKKKREENQFVFIVYFRIYLLNVNKRLFRE